LVVWFIVQRCVTRVSMECPPLCYSSGRCLISCINTCTYSIYITMLPLLLLLGLFT